MKKKEKEKWMGEGKWGERLVGEERGETAVGHKIIHIKYRQINKPYKRLNHRTKLNKQNYPSLFAASFSYSYL